MHMDNPDALACAIINDIYDAKLPILRNIYSDEHKEKVLNNSDDKSDNSKQSKTISTNS